MFRMNFHKVKTVHKFVSKTLITAPVQGCRDYLQNYGLNITYFGIKKSTF